MKYFLGLIRFVVGVLFIFSGVVKANDPLGLVYKMKEFFEVLHMNFMEPYAMSFSILMIAFEIICGMAVLLGFAFRVFSVLLLLLNMLFTFLTAYAWFTDTVKECGCFGACIKISNSATFYKDVILLILSIILFIFRKRVNPLFSKYPNTVVIILTTFFAFGAQWWSLEHLPYYDCLAYKPGNNLWQKMQIPAGATPAVYESVMIYEKNGVKKEFNMQNYPWQDSTWKFVDRKDKLIKEATGEPEIRDFTLTDYEGGDHTKEILTTPGYTFLLFVRDANSARSDNADRLQTLIHEAHKDNIGFYVVTSSNKNDAMALQHKWNMAGTDFLQLDATVNKTAMRSNPGLMLLKDGVIVQKWSYRDYPKDFSLDNGKNEATIVLRYLARRIRYSLLVLWGVVTLVFFLFNVLPGDPARLTMGQRTDKATTENVRKEMNLDKPMLSRYFLYLDDISPIGLHGRDKEAENKYHYLSLFPVSKNTCVALKWPYLGRSYRTKREVNTVLSEALPGTIILALAAMTLATIVGILLGVLAALKKDTWMDTSAVAASVAGISMPSFFAGLIIAWLFGYVLHGYTGLNMTGSLWEYDPFTGRHFAPKNLILPALALGIRPLAIITQLTRSALLDVLSQDYIRTAYAKGLSRTKVVFRHALPNALNPVITAISGWLAELLAGAFFVEYIFGWKGVGKLTVDGLDKFDFPIVMGSVLLTAVIFILVNLITDLLYGWLDPRVRLY